MLDKVNLIIIYGKKGSYKSSLSTILVNGLGDIACYIDLENNRHLKINANVKIINDINLVNRSLIEDLISDYDTVVVDSIEALDLKQEDLIYLKELAKNNKTKLIVLSNSTSDDNFKDIADLMICSQRK